MGRTEYDTIAARALGRRRTMSAIMIFVAVPALIAISTLMGNGDHYMLISLLVVGCCMAPFFVVFEKRKPKAREIVLLAMMTAITVAAHIFLHMLLPIQIGTALVVVAGISMGPEAGFLVGAMARFICNFYMGQGPWTPWQMFSWGLLGFLAGLTFARADARMTGRSSQNMSLTGIMAPVLSVAAFEVLAYVICLITGSKLTEDGAPVIYACGIAGLISGLVLTRKKLSPDGVSTTVFTFAATVILYGGLMNLCSFVTTASMSGEEGLSWNTLRLIYAAGLPYDIMHGLAASACMFIVGPTMISKLERIKIKYGIYR